MEFFIPKIKKGDHETVYNDILALIADQLKLQISKRKIYSINYQKDKKEVVTEVGKLEHNGRYIVVAIFEANPYVIFTQTVSGDRGVTMLVGKETITSVTDFD